MKNENNIAAVYIRVSTDNQTEYSPDAQLKAIKEYAKKKGLQIDPKYIFQDDGISGKNAKNRPEFMRMIATAKTKPNSPFSKILVHKFDRFARNREDSVVYKSLLKRECKVDVISITEDFGEDKFSVILEAMLEAMAEYYSLNLSDEVLKGMTEKAGRGERQTKAPFGYDIVNQTMVINKEESQIVKMIFSDYLNNSSFKTIAKKLNSLNIKSKRNNKFEVRTIEYILRNPIYAGINRWCPNCKNSWDFKYRENNSIIKEATEDVKIISQEDFDKVQERIKSNKEKFKYIKPSVEQHWLRKLVKCSNCNSTLTMSKTALQCIGYSHGSCNESHYISINKISKAIISQLKKDFTEPIHLNIKKVNKTFDEFEIIENSINSLKDKLDRCKKLYLEGIDTLEEYKESKISIEKEIEKLKSKLNSIKKTDNIDINEIKINVKNVYELLTNDKIDMEIKYDAVHSLIDKIMYDKKNETLEIYYKI